MHKAFGFLLAISSKRPLYYKTVLITFLAEIAHSFASLARDVQGEYSTRRLRHPLPIMPSHWESTSLTNSFGILTFLFFYLLLPLLVK